MPPDINEYIHSLKASRILGSQVAFHRVEDPQAPDYGPQLQTGASPVGWPPIISRALAKAGITALYRHQIEALQRVRRQEHVVVATPTASGKTLVYNLPVLEQIEAAAASTALYLFPLKALAQDQLRTFQELIAPLNLSAAAAIYDGDTTPWQRRKIREKPPHVLITNPEMLHLSLLAHHPKWAAFYRHLKVVVVDEVHVYRGLLGSHLAQVFRRLRRICDYYGAQPVFVFCSATISNPEELAEQLTGLQVTAITSSGAPVGKRHLLFINPFDSPARTAILLLKAALHRGLRSIVYCQSRKMTELIALWAAQQSGSFKNQISAYRAGFLPEERRTIEGQLARRELLAVVTTSALELGIDIGDLDLCILVGYPGTIVATRQRAGRVGRSGQDAALILIAGEDALDQYVIHHPQTFVEMPPEAAVVNPWNPDIMARHLVCAARENPLRPDEAWLQTPAVARLAQRMVADGALLQAADLSALYAGRGPQHRDVDLRSGGARYTIFCRSSGALLGEIDGVRAFKETHPGAIYLHNRRTWLVEDLDLEARTVTVRAARPPYYTRVRASKETDILEQLAEHTFDDVQVGLGRLKVTEQISGYEKWLLRGNRKLNVMPLALPPMIFETEGIWLAIPRVIQEAVEKKLLHFMGGLHALEHAAIGIFPLLVMTDRNDLGGIASPLHPQLDGPAVFIYDAVAGGAGLTRQAFARIPDLIAHTRGAITRCPCEYGCPGCVQSPRCGSGNRPLDKTAARLMLAHLEARLPTSQVAERPPPAWLPAVPTTLPPSPASQPTVYGVLDLETQLAAEEVGGWQNAHQMRISCAVLYDSRKNTLQDYTEDQVPDLLEDLQNLTLIIGFNIKRFDYRVLSAYTDANLADLPTLDLLEDIQRRLGYRLSLNHLVHETLGQSKSADGRQALIWWKEGRLDEIIRYCRQDVLVTRDLFRFGRTHGYVLFRNKAKAQVRLPVGW